MAFAGSWYPATAKECEASIKGFLKDKQDMMASMNFIGGIVPHAGWYYSGSIACRVIALLEHTEKIDTIIVFGAHMHKHSEPFILSHGLIETPLGKIKVDKTMVDKICDNISIKRVMPQNFPDENTLELQYPFIKYFYPDTKIIVCAVAPSSFAAVIGSTIARQAKKMSKNIRVIGSTDMTHYGPDFGFTTKGTGKKAVEWVKNENDKNAVQAMIKMDESNIIDQGLKNKNMCCPGAAAATAAACKELGAVKAVELDYATSFEKSAGSSFVGYSGILYSSA